MSIHELRRDDGIQLRLGMHGREAVAAARVLARRPYELTSASTLATHVGSSVGRTRRTLAVLKRAGLVESAAGPDGGFRLSRAPGEVSMLEVFEAAGGDLRSTACLLGGGECDGGCDAHAAWWAAQEAMRASLAATSLAGRPLG